MDGTAAFIRARDLLLRHREDYERACAEFTWPRLEHFNWALDIFDVQARGNDRAALWIVNEGGEEFRRSFAELAERSSQVANFLRGLGVRRGDCVLVMLPNVVELWELTLACIKLGAVVSPATTLLPAEDLADRIARGQVRHVVSIAAECPKFDAAAAGLTRIVVGAAVPGWTAFGDSAHAPATFRPDGPTPAQDPCLLYFTSGTTAKPKMVLHSQQSYAVGHLTTMYWLGLRAGDLHYNISSPGWAKHAWSCFFAPWNAGATVFVHNQARFDPAATLRALQRCGVTTLCAPPTAWRAIILERLEGYELRLRELASAGEPLNPEVIERVRKAWGLTIREGYGQTESTAMLGCTPGQPVRPGSMGRPLPGYEVALLDAEGRPVEEGEVSIALDPRPLGLLSAYAGDAARTARLREGAYYGTGDVARRDADGYYWFIGRTDDVFKSSDYRISPFELESALIEHPAVAEAAVVESPDPRRLCVPKAFICLAPGHEADARTARSLFAFIRKRLAPYQRVRLLEFTVLPKTVSGKIRRAELRRLEAERRRAGQVVPGEFREEDFPEGGRGSAG